MCLSALFTSYIFAVYSLKSGCEWPLTAQTLCLHSPVNSNGPQCRWRARLWSVYGSVCAFFCWLFLRSAPGLSLAWLAVLRQTSLEVYRVSAGMLGIGTWLKSYTRSLFPLSTETPRGSYLRKHGIPVCAVKQYSTATTQRVHTCNTTRLSNQPGQWVRENASP